MSEQLEIQKLVAWLEGHPGEPPPAELDGDIVETVYVLRPDLAPAPRVRIEDIIGRIQTGPLTGAPRELSGEFAEPTALPAEDLPSFATEEVPTEIVMGRDLEDRAANSNPDNLSFLHRNRRSIWTGAATVSVAALVLFVVLPMNNEYSTSGMSMSAAPVSAPSTPEPLASPELAPNADPSVLNRSLQDEVLEIAEEAGGLPEPHSQLDLSRKRTPQSVLLEEVSGNLAFDDSISEPMIGSADSSGSNLDGGNILGSGSGSGAGGAGFDSMGSSTSRSASEGGVAYKARTEFDFEGLDVSNEMARSAPSSSAPTPESAAAKSAQRGRRGRHSERTQSRSAPSEDVELYAEAPPSKAADLESAKRMSSVSDYNSQWYKGALSVSEAGIIDLAIQSGRTGPLSSLIGHADYRVGQDMAFRAATLTYRDGRATSALALIQRGKDRSSANTAFLSVLYNLEGEIHQALGDLPAAEQAFRSSASLNQARTR